MDSKFIADRITELRLKKNVSEYQMSLDLGRNKTYIQSMHSAEPSGLRCVSERTLCRA